MDKNMNVLVVDDFATMRRIVKSSLKSLGFTNAIEAEDGKIALKELEKDEFGLIISDWNMPNMTGIEFLRAVRSDDRFKDIPFIMVTAEGQKQNIVEAVNSGVSNYIIKPFSPETLGDKIKKVFSAQN